MKKRPVVLCILDGYGLTDRIDGNAVKLANTPNLDDLMAMYPTTKIKACGNAVGLPEGQMGNSEAVSYTHLDLRHQVLYVQYDPSFVLKFLLRFPSQVQIQRFHTYISHPLLKHYNIIFSIGVNKIVK